MQSRAKIGAAIALTILTAVVAAWYLAPDRQAAEFARASESFATQVNSLYEILQPGEHGTVSLDVRGTHALILLAPYCPREHIEACIGRSSRLADKLTQLSMSDSICPALVWVRDGKVVAIHPARFATAINFDIHCWTVKDHLAVRVEKEASSPNPFLSLRFVEDQSP